MIKDVSITVFYSESNHYKEMLSKVKIFYRPLKFNCYIIVNTLRDEIYIDNGGVGKVIQVPDINVEMEFSGYYEGLQAFLRQNKWLDGLDNIDAYFTNDTVFSHGKLRKIEKIAFNEWKLKYLFWEFVLRGNRTKQPILSGFMHKPSFFSKLSDLDGGYINSKFFIIKNVPVEKINKAFALNEIIVDVDLLTSRYYNNIFNSDSYNSFLATWLHGGKNVRAIAWYKAQLLHENNKQFFLSKARSIIHEHLFSIRLKREKVKIKCLAKSSFSLRLIRLLTGVKYQ